MSNRKSAEQVQKDISDLKDLGYVQELFRGMGGFSNFAVSFSVVSILTGISQLYGYGLAHGGPLQMSFGWLVVSIFTMTVALSMAELASAYPTAGALYHWSSILGGTKLGWFTACFNTIGQFAILAGIDYGLALFFIGLMGWTSTPALLMGVYFAILFSHAFLNHFGIKTVTWLNNFSAWYHIATVLILFVALAHKGFAQPVIFLTRFHSVGPESHTYSFLVGLLLAQWTLTGYDASAHVTEETLDPRRNAPKGIFLAVAVSILFGFLMLAAVTLSIPNLDQAVGFGDQALTEILKLRLGPTEGGFIVSLLAGAMWLCGLAAMTSASRMLYAFARDGGLPYSKIWAQVSSSHQTPSNAIWGLATLAVALALSVKLYSSVVSIATIALYLSYGLPIVARLIARFKGTDKVIGPWNLGKFSTLNAMIAVSWIMFISILFVMPPNEQAGQAIGILVTLLIGAWLFVVRKKFVGPRVKII